MKIFRLALSVAMVLMFLAGCGGGGSSSISTDTTAPSVPTGLTAAAASSSSIALNWTVSTDAVGVTGYKVYRGGSQVATSTTNAYTDSVLASSTTYTYTVAAHDAAGNNSAQSASASATTLALATSPVIQLAKTGQTTSYAAGDDGALQKGTAWPNPRYTNSDGTTPISGDAVVDQLTGLLWTRAANAPGPVACNPAATKTWQGALDYATCLNTNSYLGYNNWRLPNKNELRSLLNRGSINPETYLSGQGFTNFPSTGIQHWYWTSTTAVYASTDAWAVDMANGIVDTVGTKINTYYYVWPVCDAAITPTAALPKTGQTASYAAGDDGALQKGVAWPSPRFVNAGETVPLSGNTIIDTLTGLIWTKDGNAPGPTACTPTGQKTWQQALDYAACLNTNNYLGYNDWRLPNVNELDSIFANAGWADVVSYNAWPNTQGFSNVQANYYWSSTTRLSGFAWYVNSSDGFSSMINTTSAWYVWPVRTGL